MSHGFLSDRDSASQNSITFIGDRKPIGTANHIRIENTHDRVNVSGLHPLEKGFDQSLLWSSSLFGSHWAQVVYSLSTFGRSSVSSPGTWTLELSVPVLFARTKEGMVEGRESAQTPTAVAMGVRVRPQQVLGCTVTVPSVAVHRLTVAQMPPEEWA